MRKTFFTHLFFCFLLTGFAITTTAQKKGTDIVPNKAAKSSMVETWTPIQYNSGGGTIFMDDMNGVNDLAGLAARGWFFDDVDGAGLRTTFQGIASVFFAYEGPDTGYVAQNFNGAFGGGLLIDQWLISPEVTVEAGDILQFWHRSPDGNPFPDPLEVWVSSTAGTSATDFDVQLDAFQASITGWAQWVGAFPSAGTVRFAVRYYTTDGGPSGAESNYVGLDLFEIIPPCLIDQATNPDPLDGAKGVDVNLAAISWTNGAGANNVEVWFDGTLVYDGTAISTWPITGPLAYSTTYPWQIIGKNDTCSVSGPTWSFTTAADPNIVCIFMDDFEAGSGNWDITNDGGTCVWEVWDISTNGYTMPAEAMLNVLAADADECGSGSTTLTTAAMSFGVDATDWEFVWIEFDNDWRTIQASDEAYVEMSIDGGATWTVVVSWLGVDQRNTHEVWDVSPSAGFQSDVRFRFRTLQPEWDWWWAVDNFAIYFDGFVPVELTSFVASVSDGNVILNWSTSTETNNQGFDVERNSGNGFQKIGFVAGFGTSTENHSYSYVDGSLLEGSYVYRLKQIDYDGSFEYSDVVEVILTVPKVFALEQNYPNPFNPSTKIKFNLAADSRVTLTVFDILGQEVANLIGGNLLAGSHEIDFNASNFNSGVYFYRINATGVDGTNFTSVKKMILTK